MSPVFSRRLFLAFICLIAFSFEIAQSAFVPSGKVVVMWAWGANSLHTYGYYNSFLGFIRMYTLNYNHIVRGVQCTYGDGVGGTITSIFDVDVKVTISPEFILKDINEYGYNFHTELLESAVRSEYTTACSKLPTHSDFENFYRQPNYMKEYVLNAHAKWFNSLKIVHYVKHANLDYLDSSSKKILSIEATNLLYLKLEEKKVELEIKKVAISAQEIEDARLNALEDAKLARTLKLLDHPAHAAIEIEKAKNQHPTNVYVVPSR